MGVEAVGHGGHHDAGDEDDHAEGDGAAVAGELCSPRGCRQLALADQGDGGYHTLIVVALLRGCRIGVLWGAQDLFDGIVCHLGGLHSARPQARAGSAEHVLHCGEKSMSSTNYLWDKWEHRSIPLESQTTRHSDPTRIYAKINGDTTDGEGSQSHLIAVNNMYVSARKNKLTDQDRHQH